MKLHSLQISNVLSFAHHDNILDAPIVKFEEGLNMLIGQNGAGKSTVLEVINFVFKRVVLAQFQRNQDLYERRSSVAQQEVRQVITRRTDQQAVTYGGFLPSSPFLGALAYIRERRVGLSVYLDDPEVSIDTNHLERALRVIPMGKKNWLFSWTELGAKHIGIVQGLLATCRLHDINPYDYFVDVLQRVGHPASLVHQLTPRIWKELFAANPLRSELHDLGGRRAYAVA